MTCANEESRAREVAVPRTSPAAASAAPSRMPMRLRVIAPSGLVATSCADERTRRFQILLADCVRCPERERTDGPGRVVAGVLRKYARAHHEEVVNVPGLQVPVDDARLRVRPHDRAPRV